MHGRHANLSAVCLPPCEVPCVTDVVLRRSKLTTVGVAQRYLIIFKSHCICIRLCSRSQDVYVTSFWNFKMMAPTSGAISWIGVSPFGMDEQPGFRQINQVLILILSNVDSTTRSVREKARKRTPCVTSLLSILSVGVDFRNKSLERSFPSAWLLLWRS